MTKLEAIKASLDQWEENVSRSKTAQDLILGRDKCALCKKYYHSCIFHRKGDSCPVAITNHPCRYNESAYSKVMRSRYLESTNKNMEAVEALRNLLRRIYLIELRKERKLIQFDLETFSGIRKELISDFETGKKVPTDQQYQALIGVLEDGSN